MGLKKNKESVFGPLEDIISRYSLSREGEVHTKSVPIPAPFQGKFRVDDELEPSRYIHMDFNEIHSSYYIGINDIQFYNNAGEKIPYTNISVDGEDVDDKLVKPAFPPKGWWAVAGDEHSLVFDFGGVVHVKEIYIWCANSASTPKVIRVTDARKPIEEQSGSTNNNNRDAFSKDRCFQLAGDTKVNVEKTSFRRWETKQKVNITLADVVGILNANPPSNGFQSFMTANGNNLFVFYAKGCKTRAMNYYLGNDPAEAIQLANSNLSRVGRKINDVAKRAMTLKELRAVRAIILSKCVKQKWKSSLDNETRLRPDDVNLYDLNEILIKPLTKKDNVSFKELFTSGDTAPVYYVSHWWGERALDFIQCCEYHATMHGLDPSVASYWVCAYANRQHDLGSDLGTDPSKSSFNRAMQLSRGVLLVVDPRVVVTSRIWVDYELFRTIQTKSLLDVAIFNRGVVSLIADEALVNEHPYQRNIRETKFPFEEVCDKFFQLQLHTGEASLEIDKVRILNVMRGNAKNLDSRSVLTRTVIADPSDKKYLEDMQKFNTVDNTLRAAMAEKALSISLSKQDQTMEDFYGINLLDILKNDVFRNSLVFDDLLALDTVTDADVKKIIGLISPNIETFTLDVCGCTNLTDDAFDGISLPNTLVHLDLNFGSAPNITNDAVIEFAKKIPSGLKSLKLNTTGFKNPDGTFSPPRSDSHLQAIASAASASLESFELTSVLEHDDLHGMGIIDLAKCMPMGLKKFSLDLIWSGFNPKSLNIMIGYFPSTLEHLTLRFSGGDFIDDKSLKILAGEVSKLINLKSFQLNSSDSGKMGYYCTRDITSLESLISIARKL